MQTGVFCAFSQATPPALIAGAAKAVEERGFHAIWVPEHVVFFREYASRYPYAEDGRLTGFADGMMEPFAALGYVAAHTSSIRLGTSVCLVPQRNPVYTAKQVADVDFLSGGRFTFGVGLGWLREEYAALDVPWAGRARRLRDHIGVMKALWCDEVSAYDGEEYHLPPCVQLPKPVQNPHPPIFFGGEGDAALRRVADIGQGWIGAGLEPEAFPGRLARLDALLAERGRSRADIEVYVLPNRPPDPDRIKRYEDLGIAQVIYMVPLRDVDDYRSRLDRLARIVAV